LKLHVLINILNLNKGRTRRKLYFIFLMAMFPLIIQNSRSHNPELQLHQLCARL